MNKTNKLVIVLLVLLGIATIVLITIRNQGISTRVSEEQEALALVLKPGNTPIRTEIYVDKNLGKGRCVRVIFTGPGGDPLRAYFGSWNGSECTKLGNPAGMPNPFTNRTLRLKSDDIGQDNGDGTCSIQINGQTLTGTPIYTYGGWMNHTQTYAGCDVSQAAAAAINEAYIETKATN